jgi:succinate dehydrogenase / fumarate reductase iron-sulfur subunit
MTTGPSIIARRRLTLRVWRQAGPAAPGHFEQHELADLHPDLSLLEALDGLNERLVRAGLRPIAFESDCREGICGACGVVVDGHPHGPRPRTTTCQVLVRAFADGATVTLEPFATGTFPVRRDLIVDRSALDRIVAAGGYISVRAGSAPEANAMLVPRAVAEQALDAAACIGCGACVAACPNGSASLFVGAKLRHLSLLPQGQPERRRRARALIAAADAEGFGGCSAHGACQDACPQGIDLRAVVHLNREVLRAALAPDRG